MDSIGRNIFIIEKHFRLFFKNSLQKYNLNTSEGMVLLLMYEKQDKPNDNTVDSFHKALQGKTQDEMIGEIHYDKSVMTRTMQTLESKGYVDRNQNPNDSRSYIFTLTQKAADFRQTLLDILILWNDSLLKGIPSGNVDIVMKTLSEMSVNTIEFITSKGESL